MAVFGYLELRLMVMTSLTTSWRVVVPVRIPGGNMKLFPSFFLSFSLLLLLSLLTSDWEMGFIIHILGFFDWAFGNRYGLTRLTNSETEIGSLQSYTQFMIH